MNLINNIQEQLILFNRQLFDIKRDFFLKSINKEEYLSKKGQVDLLIKEYEQGLTKLTKPKEPVMVSLSDLENEGIVTTLY